MEDTRAIRDLLVTLTDLGFAVVLTAYGPSFDGQEECYAQIVNTNYNEDADEVIYRQEERYAVGNDVMDALSILVGEVVTQGLAVLDDE